MSPEKDSLARRFGDVFQNMATGECPTDVNGVTFEGGEGGTLPSEGASDSFSLAAYQAESHAV